MSGIDILSLQPHQVSRDLKGYSVFLYGEEKSGKTTTASKFPRALLLAFEKGYNALPGVMAQPILSWSDFRKVLKQLKSDAAKAMYETIIIDTADIAYDLCEKYICANAKRPDGGFGVDAIGDVPYGKGYTLLAKEFDECLRSIVQMDYGLVLISHAVDKPFKDEQGQEYSKIVPTLGSKPRNIVSRMCDIIGYSRVIEDGEGGSSTKLFMRGTPRYVAGSRFKYTPDYIDFSYNNLVNAIADAIDRQAAEEGEQYFTNERQNAHKALSAPLDFDALISEFNGIINKLIAADEAKFGEYWAPRITEIVERYLGKGIKVNDCSREQVEALDLILSDLKELL